MFHSHFLALLDYVSRAHEISKFVRLLSVRPCRNYLCTYNARNSFKFWLLLPLSHRLKHFLNFWKKNFFFVRIFFAFVNMGPYGSPDLETLLLQIGAESFQTFSEISSQWSTQNYGFDFWNFENWNFLMILFSFSLTWDPMGVKISKRYSSYKSQPKVFKVLLNFLRNGPHKTMFGIFESLKF